MVHVNGIISVLSLKLTLSPSTTFTPTEKPVETALCFPEAACDVAGSRPVTTGAQTNLSTGQNAIMAISLCRTPANGAVFLSGSIIIAKTAAFCFQRQLYNHV